MKKNTLSLIFTSWILFSGFSCICNNDNKKDTAEVPHNWQEKIDHYMIYYGQLSPETTATAKTYQLVILHPLIRKQ